MTRSRWWTLVAVLALALTPILPGTHAGETPTPPAGSVPPAQHKQYGHFILDNVRVNAMGVTCTIKRIRFLYKGDGLDNDVAKFVLSNGKEVSTNGPPSPTPGCSPSSSSMVLPSGFYLSTPSNAIGISETSTKAAKAELKKADGSDSKVEKGTAKPE